MHIEVSEETGKELQRRADAAGLSIWQYLEGLLVPKATHLQGPKPEPPTVEEWLEMVRKSSARLERNGRPWRELTHEGHKY